MRDIYTESVIPITPSIWDKLVKYLLMGLLGICLVIVFLFGLLGLIPLAVCGYLLYRQLQKTNGEFEYAHTNDIFDVDQVIFNSTRKQLCSIDLNQVILVAPADSDEVTAYGPIPETDFSGNGTQTQRYAMIYTVDGRPRKLLLWLDVSMRQSLKQWLPGKVKSPL